MNPELLAALRDPSFYGGDAAEVEIIETHASTVFLAGARVLKLKKPVDLGFLDYSTLPRREAMCRAEVELNRRLAPDVYVRVVAITRDADRFVLDGGGTVVEWAVEMLRMPDAASWSAMLTRGELGSEHARVVGERIARFHAEATRGPVAASWAVFEPVAQACRDNFLALAPADELVTRLRALTEAELARRRTAIDARAAAGVACEIHGDLRLEHVYDLGGRARPEDLRILDCVEFSAALRHGDPVADIAFLVMDLRMHGAWAQADALLSSWSSTRNDPGAAELLPFYAAYRSMVRAKVRGLQAEATGIAAETRARVRTSARGHLVLAYGELAAPADRPALVLVAGLPGTGKSRLAADIEARAAMTWIRADAVRKELAGLSDRASGRADIEAGLYTHAWNDRTYGECLARAERLLTSGGRVVVDASFKDEHRREAFLDLARRLGTRARIFCCVAPAAAVRARLAERVDDPSDADWSIYEHAERTWDAYGARTREWVTEIDTDLAHELAVGHALARLRDDGLLG
ncbi:MAG: AAA family ATPase [Deltaproteobacteria bacterium]|nr:AAA family ATPase [Nannocystaceae bacterium]